MRSYRLSAIGVILFALFSPGMASAITTTPTELARQVEIRANRTSFADLENYPKIGNNVSSHEYLARLHHVASIYLNQFEIEKFQIWNDRLYAKAHALGDQRYIQLSQLNRLASRLYDGDQLVSAQISIIRDTSKDWYVNIYARVYLAYGQFDTDAGLVIRSMAEAADLVKDKDADSQTAYAVIWETTGLALKALHDSKGATEALARSEKFISATHRPRPDFDTVFNLTRLAIANGDRALAKPLLETHHRLAERSGLLSIRLWDAGLCGRFAQTFGTLSETLECFRQVPPGTRDIDLQSAGILSARAIALARLHRQTEARQDLVRIKNLASAGFRPPGLISPIPLIEAEIMAAEGKLDLALDRMRAYRLAESAAEAQHFDSGIHQLTRLMRAQLGALRHNAELNEAVVYGQGILGALGLVVILGCGLFVLRERRLNATLRAAQKRADEANRAKSDFLANMSHEIRTPLNGVLGMAEVMQVGPLSPEQRARLDVIQQSGRSLLAIINAVLDLSKIEAGKIVLEAITFDLRALIQQSYLANQPLADAKALSFTLSISPLVASNYQGDPIRIRQILDNLVSNAIKFTPRGSVTIRVEDDGRLRIHVRDTGVGMTPEVAGRILAKFEQADNSTTRSFGGSGLGLSIARALALAMGGDIEIDSKPGIGSELTVTLDVPPTPMSASGPSPTETRAAMEADIGDPLKILVAEDNPTNQMVIRALLENIAAQIHCVADGEAAVRAAASEDFDVVLMDVHMPVLSGLDAAKQIRAEEARSSRQRVPIIALTASAMNHQVQECLAAGMDGHVPKPIEARVLFAALADARSPRHPTHGGRADQTRSLGTV